MKHAFKTVAAWLLMGGMLMMGACDSSVMEENDEPVGTRPSATEDTGSLSGDEVAGALAGDASKYGIFGGVVSVMTRNMYVGTDVDAVMAAPPAELPAAVARAWEMLQQTDFPGRMKALAREISRARPQLVGLQEVTTFRAQTPGDAAFGGTTPAEDVQMDFLAALLAELEALGHSYRAVAQVQNIDVEMPLIINPDPSAFLSTDIRLTDYDVILARNDVETTNVTEANYAAYFSIFGGSVDIKRGYVGVDATIRGKTYRFVSTHLEPVETFDGYFQGLQAEELLGVLASETKPLILVGDFNSDAPTGAVYNAVVSAGYDDVWTLGRGRRNHGYTCCQSPDLSNRRSELSRRIDLIFVRNLAESFHKHRGVLTFSRVTGAFPWEKTRSGLWSSDHAGVASWILIPHG